MEPAGRDTFQAKTVRNREAVPPGTPNLPGNGTVKEKHRVLHSVIDKVFNWNNLKSASRKVDKEQGQCGRGRDERQAMAGERRGTPARVTLATHTGHVPKQTGIAVLYSQAGERKAATARHSRSN